MRNLTSRSRHAHVIHMLDTAGTIQAKAHQGLRASRSRLARSVAISIGIAVSIGSTPLEAGQIDATQSNKQMILRLADNQLTEKQYQCHNEIIYRESRWDEKAVGNIGGTKQAYGLYQLKIESMKKAHPIQQFWKYWDYVAYRYGLTEYDEPMYCAALHHLRTKGWQ